MRPLLILFAFLACATAQYPNSNYGAPQAYGVPQSGGYGSSGQGPAALVDPGPTEDTRPIIIKKHVFVHIAPDDESSGVARRIQAPIPRERQVNILFVKAPAPAAPDQQIVEIPNDGGKKTLVYVLLKKQDSTPDVDFKLATPTQASKPEIYFIRYKDQKTGADVPANEAAQYGVPSKVGGY